MSSPQYTYVPPPPPPPQQPDNRARLRIALASGAIIASLAANAFLLYQVHDLREDTAHNREIMQNEIDTIKESSTVMTAAQRKKVEDLREELENRARQSIQAASQAKREALSYADEQARKLAEEQQKSSQERSEERRVGKEGRSRGWAYS